MNSTIEREKVMIREILINSHIVTGKTTITVFPIRGISNARDYDEPTKSSRGRLENMMKKYETHTYLRENGISVWIAR